MEHCQRWSIRWTACAAAIACAACGADEKPAQPQACQAVTAHANVTVGSGDDGDPAAPRRASEYVADKDAVRARTYMVVTDQPLASKAGCDVLESGGSAIDAAVVVQMVLGLVEPQSSGIGGGLFLVHFDGSKVEAARSQ